MVEKIIHLFNMKNFFNFKNKNVLIMGGSSGFGAEIAKLFNSQGSRVWITGRNIKKLKNVYKKCKNKSKIFYNSLDVNDQNELKNYIDLLKKKIQHLNIIIYCCGTNKRSEFNKISNSDFKSVLNTNFISAFNFYKLIYPLIKSKKIKTRIINFTSIFSGRTYENRTSYSTSKAALKALTKNLALEWCNKNITVNCISPGPFLTEINLPVVKNKKNYNDFCQKIPLRRFGNTSEILSSVIFLASDESSYVNGSEIVVDGGWTIK